MSAIHHTMATDGILYNAEVEYLKGTGTQYINTGIKTANDIDIKVTVDFTDNTKLCWLFGAEEASTKNSLAAYGAKGGYSFLFNRANNAQYNATGRVILQTGFSGGFVNGVKKITTSGSLSWFGDILLFTANRGGKPNLRETSTIRIIDMVILRSGAELMHLIPVRKGNVGYMYDKVSGKLFGNAGTGAFILGPDAVSANGGGCNRRCIRRSYRRSWRASTRFSPRHLWKEVA